MQDVGRKRLVAPESSAPLVGLLFQRVLQTLRAAGFLVFVCLLGPESKRMRFGCVCGDLWKHDLVFLERASVVGRCFLVSAVGLFNSYTNFRLTTSSSLPASQVGLSQISLSTGLHQSIQRWSLLVLPPMGSSLVAALLWFGLS